MFDTGFGVDVIEPLHADCSRPENCLKKNPDLTRPVKSAFTIYGEGLDVATLVLYQFSLSLAVLLLQIRPRVESRNPLFDLSLEEPV